MSDDLTGLSFEEALQDMTWAQYHDTARRFALGLLKLGFERGQRLAGCSTRRSCASSN